MVLAVRIISTMSCFGTIVICTILLKQNRRPSYFKCAFYGLLPLCFSGVYAIALAITENVADGFSLSVLGEAAAYLFVSAANRSLIPLEESEQRQPIAPVAFIVMSAFLMLLFVPIWFQYDVLALFTAIIYAFSMCPCLISCVDVCINRFENPFKKGVGGFNRMVILHMLATALFPIVGCGIPKIAEVILACFCGLLWTVSLFVGLLSLKKGLEPWKI